MPESTEITFGSYHLGLLYSESFAGILWEQNLMHFNGVGREDLESTARIISLLHETNHYVHDLSLGACLNRDFLMDEASVILFELLRLITSESVVTCPLIIPDQVNDKFKRKDYSDALALADEQIKFAEQSFNKAHKIDTTALATESKNGLDEYTTLTGMHLLEGIVALKTLHSIAHRAQNSADLEYLREIQEDLPLLPEALPPTYNLALRLSDATIGQTIFGYNPREIRNWPDDVLQDGPRKLADIAFLYLADLALHLPPKETMLKNIKDGINTYKDFDPVLRFEKAINAIQNNDGFPPADEGGGATFYKVLFDFIAHQNGWPGYEETQGAWEAKLLLLRDKYRRSMSDGFRFRMLVERRKNSMSVLLLDPMRICMSQAVPILHNTPKGLKLLRMLPAHDNKAFSLPFEFPNFHPWGLMNQKPVEWKNSTKEGSIELELERGMTFMQEVVMRSFNRALLRAILYEHYLTCPWAGNGCHVAEPGCKKITDLGNIPKKECALRKYVNWGGINLDKIVWK